MVKKIQSKKKKNSSREISSELTHWMSAGNSSKVKHAVFSTFHRILDDLMITETTAKALIIFQIIQLLAITVNQDNTVLSLHIPKSLLGFMNFSLVYPLLESVNIYTSSLFIIPIVLYLFWVIWGFSAIYNLPEKEHKKYGGLKQNYGLGLYLIDSILICPFFGIILRLFMCNSNGATEITSTANHPKCLSSTHLALSLISLLLACLFLTIVIIVGLFFFNYFFSQRDAFARSSNITHLLFRLYQFLVVIIDLFLINSGQLKLTVNLFVHTIFAIVFCIDYYNRLPYYNMTVSETYCFCISSYFWINSVLLISHLVDTAIILDNVIYIILIGQIFFLYIVKTFRAYFYTQLVIKEIDEINNEIHLEIRFRYLISIVKNAKKDKQFELLLTSLIKVHTEKCKDPSCICKNRKGLFDPKDDEFSDLKKRLFKDTVFIKHYLLMLIKKSVKKIPKSALLNIDHFLFLFEELTNIPLVNKSILIFEKQFNNNLMITVQYAIYRMRISIYYYLKKLNKSMPSSAILYEDIRTYDETMLNLKNNCLKTIDEFSRMWDILNHPAPDLKQLEIVCTKLTDLKEINHKLYLEILELTNCSLEFLSIMTIYANYIVFDDLLMSEVNENIKLRLPGTIEDSMKISQKHFKSLFINLHESCCSIIISFNYENIGEIVYASKSCEEIFKYEYNYLKSFNVNVLQPICIAKVHNDILLDYLSTGRANVSRVPLHLWGIDKEKVLFSMLNTIKLFISKEGLTVVSLIKRLNDTDYLLLNERGEINGMGSKVRKLLGIKKENIEKGDIFSIFLVCPALIPVFLPLFYQLKDFKFKNIEWEEVEKRLNRFYFFFSNDYGDKLVKISDGLRTLNSRFKKEFNQMSKEELSEYWEEYCNVLYNELKNPQIRNLDKSYKIWARVKKLKFSRNLTLWEIKIENLQKMREDCMRTQIWKKETAFIEKLNMDLPRKNAIMKYLNKMNGVEEEEISKEGIKAAHKIIGRSSASGGGLGGFKKKFGFKKKKSRVDGKGSATAVGGANKDGNGDQPGSKSKASLLNFRKNKKRNSVIKKKTTLSKNIEDAGKGNLEGNTKLGASKLSGFKSKLGAKKVPPKLDSKSKIAAPNTSAKPKAGSLSSKLKGFGSKSKGLALPTKKDNDHSLKVTPAKETAAKPKKKIGGLAGKFKGLGGGNKLGIGGSNAAAGKKDGKKGSSFLQRMKGRLAGTLKEDTNKLKLALDLAPDEYVKYSLDEVIEDGLLEEESMNTYHKSDGTEMESRENKLDLAMMRQKNDQGALAKKFKKDWMVKNNLLEGGSVGSTQSRIPGRDTLKKIRMLILARRAPLALVNSYRVLVLCLLACMSISLLGYHLSDAHINNIKEFVYESNELTKLSIRMNKLSTYIEFEKLERPDFSIKFAENFEGHITQFIRTDARNELDRAKNYYDQRISNMSYLKSHTEALMKYFFTSGLFNMKDGLQMSLPNLNFIGYCLQNLIEFFKGNDKGENSKLISENLYQQIDIQNTIYDVMVEIRSTILFQFALLTIINLVLRVVMVLFSTMIAFPLVYKASLRSGDILLQLAKISQINITFYMQHYNKIGMLIKQETKLHNALDKVEIHYNSEYKLKQFREQITGSNGGARFAKLNNNDKTKWVVTGFIFFFFTIVIQSGLAIQFFFYTKDIGDRLEKILILPETSNKFTAFNALSLKLMGMKYLGLEETDGYLKGLELAGVVESFLTKSNIELTTARGDIYDSKFGKKITTLLDSNICKNIFQSSSRYKECFNESQTLGRHSIRGYLSMYQVNVWNRLEFLKKDLSKQETRNLLESDIYRKPLFSIYWLDESIRYWEVGLLEQFDRFIEFNNQASTYITGAEISLLLLLIFYIYFKRYPKIKSNILYSLSFLLLVPFHIFRENESFSSFIKRMINYQGIL